MSIERSVINNVDRGRGGSEGFWDQQRRVGKVVQETKNDLQQNLSWPFYDRPNYAEP